MYKWDLLNSIDCSTTPSWLPICKIWEIVVYVFSKNVSVHLAIIGFSAIKQGIPSLKQTTKCEPTRLESIQFYSVKARIVWITYRCQVNSSRFYLIFFNSSTIYIAMLNNITFIIIILKFLCFLSFLILDFFIWLRGQNRLSLSLTEMNYCQQRRKMFLNNFNTVRNVSPKGRNCRL